LSRLLRLRLAVDDATDFDIEEVDLAVEGDDAALRVEDEARVGELLVSLAPLSDRAPDECRPVSPGPFGHRRNRRAALDRLRVLVEDRGTPDHVPLLRQDDVVG